MKKYVTWGFCSKCLSWESCPVMNTFQLEVHRKAEDEFIHPKCPLPDMPEVPLHGDDECERCKYTNQKCEICCNNFYNQFSPMEEAGTDQANKRAESEQAEMESEGEV